MSILDERTQAYNEGVRDGVEAERRLFALAARFDTFSLDDLWKATHLPYGQISRILLHWWRGDGLTERLDKMGRWHEGYPWSQCGRGSIFNGTQAIYRWKEE